MIESGETHRTMRLADGTVGYSVRFLREDDCFAAAVATILQVPPEDVPDPRLDERLAAGENPEEVNRTAWREFEIWLAGRGLTMIVHRSVPVDAERWIGVVPLRGWFQNHCLVMSRSRLLHDPAFDARGAIAMGLPGISLEVVMSPTRALAFGPDRIRFGYSFQQSDRRRTPMKERI